MGDRRLDRLFLRFRRRGDASALGQVFDRTAPELLKLAMHLVRDPVEAEDVLQATFLAAIEGAESFDASRHVMPWLVGILARQAGLVRRRSSRVIEPDRLRERAEPDPADLASAREFSDELVAALGTLPDTYREVLWLHLADGKRPVEIARDLRRAPGTVRMQMHRGLDLLRRALPAGFAAGAIGILGQTRGLAAIRAEVLARGAARTPVPPITSAAASEGAGAASALGGAVAGSKLAIGVVGLCAAAALFWWWPREETPEAGSIGRVGSEANASSSAIPSEPSAQTLEARSPVPVGGAGQSTELATGETASRVWLRGRVAGIAPSEQSEVALSVRGIARFAWPANLVVNGRPAADGMFELDVTPLFQAAKPRRPLEDLLLTADHPRCVRAEERIPLDEPLEEEGAPLREYRAQIQLEPAGLVSGHVVAEQGAPEEAIVVALYPLAGDKPLSPPVDHGTCAADGGFTLRAREAGEYVILAMAGDSRPATARVQLAPGSRAALEPVTLLDGAVIEGTAFQGGLPMRASALVSASPDFEGDWFALEGRRVLWTGQAFERGGAMVETDEIGRFRVGGLAPNPYRLHVAQAARPEEGASPASQTRMLLSTARGTIVVAPAKQVELTAAFALVHLEVRISGEAKENAERRATVKWRQGESRIQFQLAPGERSTVAVEPRSECEIAVEMAGSVSQNLTVRTSGPGEESTEVVFLRQDPMLASLELALIAPEGAQAESGQTFGEASFVFYAREPDRPTGIAGPRTPAFARRAESGDGIFRLGGLPAGEWEVSVHAGDEYLHYRDFWCPARMQVTLFPGGDTRREIRLERGGRIRISAMNPAGAHVPAECVVRDASGDELDVKFVARRPERASSGQKLGALGASDVLPVLTAGDYSIELRAPGYEPLEVPVRVEARRCTEVRSVLRVAEVGR